jgi:TetR/AcrR family transcriptional repressor of nem operon
MARPFKDSRQKPAKEKLLDAALTLIRTKGYSSTTVDDLCEAAGVTKGTFFYYFESKETLGVEAAQYWSHVTSEFFQTAPYHDLSDPLDRFLGYIDFRKNILVGTLPEFTCVAGTLVQEIYDSHTDIRKACKDGIFGHAKSLEHDISEAKKKYSPKEKWSPKSLALHTQAVLQGAFILAKADNGPEIAVESVEHLKRYVELLFKNKNKNRTHKNQ